MYLSLAQTTRSSDKRPQCSNCGRHDGQSTYLPVPVEQRRQMSIKSNNKQANGSSSSPSQPRNFELLPNDRSSLGTRPPQQAPTKKNWFITPGILISAIADKALTDQLMKSGIADSTLICLSEPSLMDWCTDSRLVIDLMTGIDADTLDPADPLDQFLIRTNTTSSNSN